VEIDGKEFTDLPAVGEGGQLHTCMAEQGSAVAQRMCMPKQTQTILNTMKKNGKGKDSEDNKDLRKLLEDQLADIYYAEKKLTKAIPKMAKAAQDEDLVQGFETHAQETEGQVERCKQAFDMLGKPAKAKKCEAIEGLIAEAEELMKEYKGSIALDAALVDAAQKVEHYEIATYGSLIAWARQLGEEDLADLLEETLNEEKGCNDKLTELAESGLNAEAA
jgi:ferritin-like metal-binding protein YciE